MCNPIAKKLEQMGDLRIFVNSPVDKLITENGSVSGVEVKGRRIKAKHVVIATSLAPAQEILSRHLQYEKKEQY